MAVPGPKRAFEFAWLLRNVSLTAMDNLVSCLERDGSIGAARLACRALRDAIDDSVQQMRIPASPDNGELYASGGPPTLERWPRCSSVEVVVPQAAAFAVGGGIAAAQLLQPFIHLTPERRRAIARLRCELRGLDSVEAGPLCSLTHLLPSIRELCLHKVTLTCHPQQLALLHDALAGLKQLEMLTLPSYQALEGIGALGSSGSSSLRRLGVWDTMGCVPALRPEILAGLSQLHGLRRLTYTGVVESGGYYDARVYASFLAASLPPSLESMQLSIWHGAGPGCCTSLVVELQEGKLHSVEVTPPHLLSSFLQLAAAVLLPGLSPTGWPDHQSQWPPTQTQTQLERLTIPGLRVEDDYELTAEDVTTMLVLRQRFRHIDLRLMGIAPCTDPLLLERQLGTAWYVTQALATVPFALDVAFSLDAFSSSSGLQSRHSSTVLSLGARPAAAAPGGSSEGSAGSEAASAATGAVRAATSQQERPASSGSSCASDDSPTGDTGTPLVLPTAAQLLAKLTRDPAAALEAPAAAAAGLNTCSSNFDGSDGGKELMQLVLLRGPLIASLCQMPEAVGPWLDALERQLASSGGAVSRSGSQPGAADPSGNCRSLARHIRAYQRVPTAGALLIGCEERVSRAVVAAVAEAAALHQGRLSRAQRGNASAAMEALPLGTAWLWDASDGPVALGGPLQDWLLDNIEQEMQAELLSLGAGSSISPGSLFWTALDWGFAIRSHFYWELPPVVVLQ